MNRYYTQINLLNEAEYDSSSASEAPQRTHEREKNSQRKHTRLSISCRDSREFDRLEPASSSERHAE
jgi:hypothetical protein